MMNESFLYTYILIPAYRQAGVLIPKQSGLTMTVVWKRMRYFVLILWRGDKT
uniref:Uncharacterized protein n=1 Tax=Sphingobacterium sp. (strain 21) TaxID=743722 RepID=F4C9V0_SPHS2